MTAISKKQQALKEEHRGDESLPQPLPEEITKLPEGEQFLYRVMEEYYQRREFPAKNVKVYFRNEASHPKFGQTLWEVFKTNFCIDERQFA